MNSLTSINKITPFLKSKNRDIQSSELKILTNIYQEDNNIVVWRRKLSGVLAEAAASILDSNPALQMRKVVTPQDSLSSIKKGLGNTEVATILAEDIMELVEIFCCLFDLKSTGLRLEGLGEAMCPRFHVDQVPCRLLTTYTGVATEWLPHSTADRSKLGGGNKGKSDERSGLFSNESDINQLREGDVALLKGEQWEGNKGMGIIHRSPKLSGKNRRLLLSLDFIYG